MSYRTEKSEVLKMEHYCDYFGGDSCEYYDSGYCWAHERPVSEIEVPCWADETDGEMRDT